MINNKIILVTGGTGSFGESFIKKLEKHFNPKKIIIFSRDELKQSQMRKNIDEKKLKKYRFFIGDVRDQDRLISACKGVDIVIHAAALKQVDSAEYNPSEAIKTNIIGAENVVKASLQNNVGHILALSTDKACSPINLYGATKLASDKIFISANNIKGTAKCKFSVLRYGNVMGSRGSVLPFFLELKKQNKPLTITDRSMTRFSLTLEEGIDFAFLSLKMMVGGELFVPKIPSFRIMDLVKAIGNKSKIKIIGIRPGEKLHEDLISVSDSRKTIDSSKFYIIRPDVLVAPWSEKVFRKHNKLGKLKYCKKDFYYSSNSNKKFLTVSELKKLIDKKIKY